MFRNTSDFDLSPFHHYQYIYILSTFLVNIDVKFQIIGKQMNHAYTSKLVHPYGVFSLYKHINGMVPIKVLPSCVIMKCIHILAMSSGK